MPDAAAVRRVERLGHLHPVLDGLPVRAAPAVEPRPQRLALEHFGDKYGTPSAVPTSNTVTMLG